MVVGGPGIASGVEEQGIMLEDIDEITEGRMGAGWGGSRLQSPESGGTLKGKIESLPVSGAREYCGGCLGRGWIVSVLP